MPKLQGGTYDVRNNVFLGVTISGRTAVANASTVLLNLDGTAPNNWLSVFGGPAWAYQPARRQHYHHKFLRQQPNQLTTLLPSAREWTSALWVVDLGPGRNGNALFLNVDSMQQHAVCYSGSASDSESGG